jgi:hypothetical protein
MLLLEVIRSLKITGQPVAMPVNRETLLITGSEDEDGLEMMAHLGEQKKDEPRPVCPVAHILNGDEWEPWLPPPDHPHYDAFRLLELKYLYGEYTDRKPLLEKRNEQQREDVYVAILSPIERNGYVSTFCVWTKGVRTWLPQAGHVVLMDLDTNQNAAVPWVVLRAVVGDLMTPLDCYPQRWLVDSFPTPEQIARMQPEDWLKKS